MQGLVQVPGVDGVDQAVLEGGAVADGDELLNSPNSVNQNHDFPSQTQGGPATLG